MPDKEFDKLFQDKFKDAEIAPSADLWAKIEDQLEAKPKRKLPIFWMAAASVAVAFTAVIALQKTEKIQLHPDDLHAAVSSTPSIQKITPSELEVDEVPANEVASTKRDVSLSVSKPAVYKVLEKNIEKNDQAMQPNESFAHLDIKKADVKPIDVLPVVVTEIPIVIAKVDDSKSTFRDEDLELVEQPVERKGIRNVGDLVNYVVDKVDKRDRKLVRFSTDDDDNSSIVGINIGFLKLNKKNNR